MRTLTDADLTRLDLYLCDLDGEAMALSELDGFLAGVIVCPELIPPSEWLGQVFGEGHMFQTPEEASELIPIVMAVYNDIAHAIGGREAYVPRLDADEDGAAVWELWASGFGRALDLRPWAWAGYDEMAEDDPDAISIRLLETLADIADARSDIELPEELAAALREDAELVIGACVEDLNEMRLAGLEAQRPVKTGRNDPCPCGSGKKYKKCCLQNENP